MDYSLNYNHTCPYVDDAISDMKHSLEINFDSVIEEAKSLFDIGDEEDNFKTFIDYTKHGLASEIVDLFEKMREIQSEMRSVAEDQLVEWKEEYESIKDYLESDIENLKEEISNLESQIENLENELIEK